MLDPVRNFCRVTLNAGIASGVTTIVLVGGDGAKMPDPSTEGAFNCTVWNATDYPNPTDDPNHEIVRVTARSTDTLTVTRAQEGTADVNHNTGGKTYKMILSLTKKTMDDINALLSSSAGSSYAGDLGETKSAVLTTTQDVTKTVDLGFVPRSLRFVITSDLAKEADWDYGGNTNIARLTAVIECSFDSDTSSGFYSVDDTTFGVSVPSSNPSLLPFYDTSLYASAYFTGTPSSIETPAVVPYTCSSSFQFKSVSIVGTVLTFTWTFTKNANNGGLRYAVRMLECKTGGSGGNTQILTAGENITKGDAVILGSGDTYKYAEETGTGGPGAGVGNPITDWSAQTFTTSIHAQAIKVVTIKMISIDSFILTCSIRAVAADIPTGADIESKTETASYAGGSGLVTKTFTFASPVTVSPSTTYAIVIRTNGNGGNWSSSGSSSYASGNIANSSNSGTSWTANLADDHAFSVTEVITEAGKIYSSDATFNNDFANNFVGFARADTLLGNSGSVTVGGVDDSQGALTPGVTYFLSNTPGLISTSAGSQSRKVGLSLSASEILIKHDNA